MSGGIVSGQKTNSLHGRYLLFIVKVMNDNWRVEQNIQRIANNSDVSNLVGIGQIRAMNVLADAVSDVAYAIDGAAEANYQTELLRHENSMTEIDAAHQSTMQEIESRLDANLTAMQEKADLADQQIRDALGTKNAEGGYLNQLIKIADGAGASLSTSTGASLSIGPKTRK